MYMYMHTNTRKGESFGLSVQLHGRGTDHFWFEAQAGTWGVGRKQIAVCRVHAWRAESADSHRGLC
jgi:hypothetical protein